MKVIKPLICLIPFCIFLFNSYSQSYYNINAPAQNGQSKDFIPASPAAASLGIFGQVPVGNYTGTASIGIPLYNINYRDLNIAVGINYHASGNKPDIFPGIVGMGWAFSAGGTVTRVVKGMPDYERYDIGNGTIIPVGYNPTGEADWSTTTSLNDRLADGGFHTDQDRTNPDEFYFNFNGITGKFYMNQLESFRVKSAGNEFFTVEAQVLENKHFTMPGLEQHSSVPFSHYYENILRQNKLIYKITITDDHGIKYIFGGTDESIEFSRPGHSYSSHSNATMDKLVTPMAWQLTSIESPNGYSITLNYERGIFVTKVGYCDITRSLWHKQGSSSPTTTVSPLPIAMGEKSTLINACYLSSIVTPKETLTFTFNNAEAQLLFPTDPNLYASGAVNENMFFWYTDIGRALTEPMLSKKLDRIEVRDANNALHKSFSFSYTNNADTRLKLGGIYIHGSDYNLGAYYTFEYDLHELPPYLSYQTDHYGYYNGRNPYINTTNSNYYLNTLDQQQFFESKEPDPAYAQAEILKRIIYPTGGYTEFEYEPHEYSTQVQTWPFTTVAGANKISGGVRIKQIASYTSAGVKAFSKNYFYVKDYLTGGATSSGVLAYQPTYYEKISGTVVPPARYASSTQDYNGTITLDHWSSNPIFPMSETRGNHVTYSEVTEVNEDWSAIVYKYKNYDNGYNDLEPVAKVSDNTNLKEFWKEEEGISMDLERGQLLSEEYYDANVTLKKRKELEYNNAPSRFDNHVRIISQTFNSLSKADIPSFRLTASLIYTYFPYLKRVTETAYEAGNQPTLTTTVNYEYDADYRMVKKVETITSDGRRATVINNYPNDMVAAGITVPYQEMVDADMVGVLISSEQQSDDIKQSKSITEYAGGLSANASLILPQYIKIQHKSRPEEIRLNYHEYDEKGNIISSSMPGGAKTCYIWSYKSTYPVAKITNAEYATVLSVLGGQQAVSDFAALMPADNDLNTFLQPLRTNASLSGAMVYTYTYHPLTGMTSETNHNNRSTYYEYDYMGRLSMVRDHDHNILRKICYNYAGQVENCGVGPGYDVTDFVHAPSSSTICNSGSILQVIRAYSKKTDPEDLVLYPAEFFWDSGLTSHPPNGYYKVTSSTVMNAGSTIYHMVDGKILGIYICP